MAPSQLEAEVLSLLKMDGETTELLYEMLADDDQRAVGSARGLTGFLDDGRQRFVSRRPPADRFPRWPLSRQRIVSIRGVSQGRALVLSERGGVDGGRGGWVAARGGQAPVGGRVTGGDRPRAGAHAPMGGQVDGAL